MASLNTRGAIPIVELTLKLQPPPERLVLCLHIGDRSGSRVDLGAKMIRRLGIGLFVLMLTACSGDPNEQANKLFVGAQTLIEQAEKQDAKEKLQTLLNANEMLKAIVSKYPASNLAVQLASGQTIGTISLSSLSEKISVVEWAVCIQTPRRACVLKHALQLAQSIKDPAWRRAAFHHIVGAQADAGNIAEALQLAQSIQTGFFMLVRAHIDAGKLAEAMALVESISDQGQRADALSEIVRGHAEAGNIAEALQLARSIELVSARAHALLNVATTQAKGGQPKEARALLGEALQLVGSMTETFVRDLVLSDIAWAQARMGMVAEALQLAQSVKGDDLRLYALSEIVRGQAEAGNIAEALQLAQSIRADAARHIALSYVAKGQRRAGLAKEAETLLQQLMRTSGSIRDEAPRVSVLAHIVGALPN